MTVEQTVVNAIEDINRSMNNVTLLMRLVWVDPAASTSRDHAIRTVGTDRSRSIRLTLWGFNDDTKDLLMSKLFHVIRWEGISVRQQREVFLENTEIIQK